jgi:hypothetical protein
MTEPNFNPNWWVMRETTLAHRVVCMALLPIWIVLVFCLGVIGALYLWAEDIWRRR